MKGSVTKEDIFNLENRLYKAIKENDVLSLDELMHDDLLFILPSGEIITKEIDINTYTNGSLKIMEFLPNIEGLNIIDDTAIITLTIGIKGSYDAKDFEAKYRYIRFWKKTAEGIKIVGGSGILHQQDEVMTSSD